MSQMSWNCPEISNCPEILLIWSECLDVDLCYAVVKLNSMQPVTVAQMMLKQETAKKLDTIGAKQRDLRKRLHDHELQ